MVEPYFRPIENEAVLSCILWTTNGGKLTTDAAVRGQTDSSFLLLKCRRLNRITSYSSWSRGMRFKLADSAGIHQANRRWPAPLLEAVLATVFARSDEQVFLVNLLVCTALTWQFLTCQGWILTSWCAFNFSTSPTNETFLLCTSNQENWLM